MKTDRELLELAAKAAGISGVWTDNYDVPYYEEYSGANGIMVHDPNDDIYVWNPMEDGGDALWLAVKLNIEFACFDDKQAVNAGVFSTGPESWDCMTPYNGDKQAAVRRAITRAAAEIQLAKERA